MLNPRITSRSRWRLALVTALALLLSSVGAWAKLVGGVQAMKVRGEEALQIKLAVDAPAQVKIVIGTNGITFDLRAPPGQVPSKDNPIELVTGKLRISGTEVQVFENGTLVCRFPVAALVEDTYKRFCYDEVKPVVRTAVSPEPNANGWNRTSVTVTVTGEDEEGGSGIKLLRYKIGTMSPVDVPLSKLTVAHGGRVATYQLPVSGEGTHNLAFWAVDEAGNESDARTLTVRIDTTPPSVSLSPSGGTYTDSVTVSWSASDGGAGLASCGLYVNGSRVSSSCSSSYTLGAGSHSVEVRAEDKAGNTATAGPRSYTVEKAAYFYVSSITVSPGTSFPTGTTARFTATVRNTGGRGAEKKISFYVDGSERDYVYRYLSAGSSTEVSFYRTFYSSGTYYIKIASPDDSSTVTVYAQEERPAYFRVDRLATSPSSPYVGRTTMIYAIITNTGGRSATKSVELWVNGRYVTSTSVYIGAGQTEGVTFEHTFYSTGSTRVEIRTPDDYDHIYVNVVYPPH